MKRTWWRRWGVYALFDDGPALVATTPFRWVAEDIWAGMTERHRWSGPQFEIEAIR